MARRRGGAFVLRLHDIGPGEQGPVGPDADAEKGLLGDLSWLGLTWDEGPSAGGEKGPYRQSERLGMYADRARELLEKRLAYRCFCTADDLREGERRARAAGLPAVYGGRCSSLSEEESDRRARAGAPFALRFRVPDSGEIVIDDLVRGRVTLGAGIVGDFVVLDPASRPTYDFAAVVDDDSMEITHVLRGEDRLPNTLRQALLHGAMRSRMPWFGHLPLVTSPQGDKLAGRHGTAGVRWFRDHGYLPQALSNYLALLGWSPEDNREIIDLDALAESFSLDRVSSDEVVFDTTKLSWINAHYIRSISAAEFWRLARESVPEGWRRDFGDTKLKEAALLARNRVRTLYELADEMRPVFELNMDEDAAEALTDGRSEKILRALLTALEGRTRFDSRDFLALLGEMSKSGRFGRREVFVSVRAAITGKLEGPELGSIAALLGAAELRRRIELALERR